MLNGTIQAPSFGQGEAAGSFLAHEALFLENLVDELKALAQDSARALDTTEPLASGGNGMTMVFIIIAVVAIIMLAAVYIVGRRNRARLAREEAADNPLFEDQYAIPDEDVVIETASAEEKPVREDDEEPAGFEILSDQSEEDEKEDAAHRQAANEAVESTMDERENDKAQDKSAANENVIPLMKRAEQEARPVTLEEDRSARNVVAAAGGERDVETAEEAVRHAFAASQRGPMAYGDLPRNKSHDDTTPRREPTLSAEDEKKPSAPTFGFAETQKPESPEPVAEKPEPPETKDSEPEQPEKEEPESLHFSPAARDHDDRMDQRPRSYIAPTVLREDFSRLERLQAERFDIMRDEMTRQISSLKADQNNRFDIVVDALDRKLAKLTEIRFEAPADGDKASASVVPILNDFTRQVNLLQSTLENQSQRIRAITQILDDRLGTVSHVYGEVRNIGDRLDKFTERLTDMEKSISDNTRLDMMSDVQLSDVVRSSLPPDSYEFKPLLSNNHRADCLIRLPHPPGTIVVDTRFPLDAYNALPSREESQRDMHNARGAEDAFRRAILRHIIDVAERFIIPGETADSALMFVPTESIYTTLHARFPDLIRDSFRARVWIVSPSTLMGTLQTLKGVLRDTRVHEDEARRAEEDNAMRHEMEDLRERASMLARNLESTQSELRAILEATDKVFDSRQRRTGSKGQNGNGGNGNGSNGRRRDYLVKELYDREAEWPKSGGQSGDKSSDDKRQSSLYEEYSRRPDPLR